MLDYDNNYLKLWILKRYHKKLFNVVKKYIYSKNNKNSKFKLLNITISDIFFTKGCENRINATLYLNNEIFKIKEIKYEKLILKFSFYLNNGIKDINLISIYDYKKECENEKTLSPYLIPYIHKDEFDEIAEEFLKEFYQQALYNPMRVSVNEIVKKMNLKLFYTKISKNTIGRMYFKNGYERIYYNSKLIKKKIKKGTILVNEDYVGNLYKGTENNTIIHECIHWKYHRNFYELMTIIGKKEKFLLCVSNYEYGNNESFGKALKWVEYQANQLSGRILMPKKSTIIKYNEVLNELKKEYSNLLLCELCEKTIDILSDFFDVSRQAVKVRLSQLNIVEAYGVYCYIDGKYHQPFQLKNNEINKAKTHLISFKDAIHLYKNNKTINKLVNDNKIVFIDNFYILNNPKYVKRKDNIIELTDYARSNIDECCLEFNIIKKYEVNEKINSYLSRNTSNNNLDIYIDEATIQNSRIIGIGCDMTIVIEEVEETKEILSKMNGDFKDSLNLLFNYSGIKSISDLSKLSKIDRRLLSSYLDGKTIPDIKKILALCAAMELYPLVSKRLIEQAGLSIGKRNKDIDIVYLFLLNQCYHEGLDKWNERIKTIYKDEYLP